MVKNWNNGEIDNLIALVKEAPALYEASLQEASDEDYKDRIWAEISRNMKTSSRNCRRKWFSLCLKFRKIEDGDRGAVLVEDGEEWPWFERMSFIKKSDFPQNEEVAGSSGAGEIVIQQERGVPLTNGASEVPSNSDMSNMRNKSSNKLFLESLVDDLSSLSRKNQYEFKRKVLVLMEGYMINKN